MSITTSGGDTPSVAVGFPGPWPRPEFPPPRKSTETLESRSGFLIVYNSTTKVYDYYYMKLGTERVGNYVSFVRPPDFVPEDEGFVVFNKKLYKVSKRDFLRSRVNVGIGPITSSTGTGRTRTRSSRAAAAVTETGASESSNVVTSSSSDSIESGASGSSGGQESHIHDMAWQEQISALLYHEDPEADWERI